MARIINCVTKSGKHVNYVDEIIGAGTMKNVYFSSDKSYVIAFYQKPQNQQARERIEMITGSYSKIYSTNKVETIGMNYFVGRQILLNIWGN